LALLYQHNDIEIIL